MNKYLLACISIFCLTFLLYWYKLPQSLIVNTDYGKDIYAVAKLSKGNFTLLGPALSAGIFAGPYYYYLMLPSLVLSNLSPYSFAFTGAVLFSASLAIVFMIFFQRYSFAKSALCTFIIGLSPLYIMASREPANGLMYLPFLLIFLGIIHFKNYFTYKTLSALGLLAGIILNFDTVAILAILPLSVYLFSKVKLKKIIIFTLFLIFTYSPLLIFELKNDFVVTKGIFVNKNYQTFVKNDNVAGAVSGNSDFFQNYVLISDRVVKQIGFTPLVAFVTLAIITFLKRKDGSGRFSLLLTNLGTLVLTTCILRYKLEFHYLFPISLLIVFSLAEAAASLQKYWFALIILAFFLSAFPADRYLQSNRTFSMFEDAVNLTLSKNLIDHNTPFNVLAVTDKHLYVPIGNEYRFFYLKKGFPPQDEYHYPESKSLLIFSEIGDYDISNIGAWEIDQFGKKYLTNPRKYSTGRVVIYHVEK